MMFKNLYINSGDDYYPEINNVSAKADCKGTFQLGHHLYENLNILMKYTGKILIGKDFLDSYWLRRFDAEPWAYEVLEELIFDNGKLVKTVDHSKIAKKLRIELDNIMTREKRYLDASDMEEYFSLEMKDKAWWIE